MFGPRSGLLQPLTRPFTSQDSEMIGSFFESLKYGGDELTLILGQSDLRAAKLVTEKIQGNLAKFAYKAPNGDAIKLGISGGIALYPNHGRSGPELLRAADAAMPQQVTDRHQVHAGLHQVRCERVPELVRRDSLVDPRPAGMRADALVDGAAAHRLAGARLEERRFR